MDKIVIAGVKINPEATDIKKVKSLSGLKKLNIFSHIEDKEARDRNENELAVQLGIKQQDDTVEAAS